MAGEYLYHNAPTIRRRRSRFDLSYTHLTSLNVGDLVPVYVQEIYPGDSFNCSASYVIRATEPFQRPVFDNLFLDIQYYFVPNRLVYDSWEQVMGQNDTSAWAPSSYAVVPTQVYSPSTGNYSFPVGTVANYMVCGASSSSVGAGSSTMPINMLPFRAFALIYDQWFRDENTQAPMSINTGVASVTEGFNSNIWSVNNYTGMVPKVNKFHDLFTSVSPSPQKGSPVSVLPGSVAAGSTTVPGAGLISYVMPVLTRSGQFSSSQLSNYPLFLTPSSGSGAATPGQGLGVSYGSGEIGYLTGAQDVNTANNLRPSNLFVPGIDVNQLRMAVATQHLLERDATYGSRYTEYIDAAFSVKSPDARLQRSEFLGGARNPISIQQVAQTSASSESDSLGSLGAYSLSAGRARYMKGFTEHGFVIGVACIRYHHIYQQGIERFWRRRSRFDYYDPIFDNIGFQPVYTSELYGGAISDVVFGYMNAWYDLRSRPNRVSGALATTSASEPGFSIWHFADYYTNPPILSPSFIQETPTFVDRTLSVESTVAPQFIVDFRFQNYATRVMAPQSIPRLVG